METKNIDKKIRGYGIFKETVEGLYIMCCSKVELSETIKHILSFVPWNSDIDVSEIFLFWSQSVDDLYSFIRSWDNIYRLSVDSLKGVHMMEIEIDKETKEVEII